MQKIKVCSGEKTFSLTWSRDLVTSGAHFSASCRIPLQRFAKSFTVCFLFAGSGDSIIWYVVRGTETVDETKEFPCEETGIWKQRRYGKYAKFVV